MLYCVKLVAEDVEVTAPNEDQASRSAAEDVNEMAHQMNFMPTEVSLVGPGDQEASAKDTFSFDFETLLTTSDYEGSDEDNDDDQELDDEESFSWTFDVSIEVYVEAESAEHAQDIAKVLFAAWDAKDGIAPEPAPGSDTIEKILEAYRQVDGEPQPHFAAGLIEMARTAVSKIPHTDPAFSVLEEIGNQKIYAGYYDRDAVARVIASAAKFTPAAGGSMRP